MTFAAAIPAIVSGGIAERARFYPMLVASGLIEKHSTQQEQNTQKQVKAAAALNRNIVTNWKPNDVVEVGKQGSNAGKRAKVVDPNWEGTGRDSEDERLGGRGLNRARATTRGR